MNVIRTLEYNSTNKNVATPDNTIQQFQSERPLDTTTTPPKKQQNRRIPTQLIDMKQR